MSSGDGVGEEVGRHTCPRGEGEGSGGKTRKKQPKAPCEAAATECHSAWGGLWRASAAARMLQAGGDKTRILVNVTQAAIERGQSHQRELGTPEPLLYRPRHSFVSSGKRGRVPSNMGHKTFSSKVF